MKRREIIKILGTSVSAGVMLPSWLSACDTDPQPGAQIEYNGVVGVIGAGAAGLHVADILKSKGISVVIFEAADRIGGRIQSFSATDQPSLSLMFDQQHALNNDFPIELGADRFYGSDSLWAKMTQSLSLPVVDLRAHAPEDSYLLDGIVKTNADLAADQAFLDARNFVNTLASHVGSEGSVEQAIVAAGLDSLYLNVLNSWMGNRYGTINYKLGIGALAEASVLREHDDALYMLQSNPVQNVVSSRFSQVIPDVRLNTQITSIEYGSDSIFLIDHLLRMTAVDKLIVTVPVSVLKSGMIQFFPSLPATKQTALGRIGMDASIRVMIEFKKPVWNTSSGFIFGGTTVPEIFNTGLGRSAARNFLSLTINGPKAAELSLLGNSMMDVIMAELDVVTNGAASEEVRRNSNGDVLAIIKDWSQEPFIRGGISYPMPGSTNADREVLAEPIDDRIFFAGEATDVAGSFGTVNGALQSAERAAQELLNSIIAQ